MNKSFARFLRFALIIGIIIAIAVPLTKTGFKMLEEKKYTDLQTDLLLIQGKVKVIQGKSEVSGNKDVYLGQKVSESDNNKIKDLLKTIGIAEDKYEKYFILSQKDFETMGIAGELKNKADSLFVVNYEEMEVVYTKGIKVDGNVKYKLSDIIKTPEKKEWILHNRMLE